MSNTQMEMFLNLARVGARIFAQNGLNGGFMLHESFLAPLAAFHYCSSIGVVLNHPPQPTVYEEVAEPDDGFEFDEDVAVEVDIDVDFSEELEMDEFRRLDPAEIDDEDVDVEAITQAHQEVSRSRMSTVAAHYDTFGLYVSPEVPIMGWWETMNWLTPQEVNGAAPVQLNETQPTPGAPVYGIEQVAEAFHNDFADPEEPVEILPRMEIDVDGIAAGKIRKPRKFRARYNPIQKPEATRRSTNRKLQF